MLADRALPGGFGHTNAFSNSETVYSHSLGKSRHHYFLCLIPSFVPKSQEPVASKKKEKGNPSPPGFLDEFICSSHCPMEHLIASIL